MDKIIPTMQAMLKHPENISDVCVGTESHVEEYFFVYGDKYKWSISQAEDGSYNLYYYALPQFTIKKIAGMRIEEQQPNLMWFTSKNFPGKEQQLAFADLYKVVKAKLFNIDAVMEDIIGDDLTPF